MKHQNWDFRMFLFYCLKTLSSSLCLSPVSSGGGPGPLKPVLPPQSLPVNQPLGGTSQPPPPINTTHPYQVMAKQPHSVRLPGEANSCRLLFGSVSDSGVHVPSLKRFPRHCLPLICLLTESAPHDCCSGGCTDGRGGSQQPEESLWVTSPLCGPNNLC